MKSKIDGFTDTERKSLQTQYLEKNIGKKIQFKNVHNFKNCFFGLIEYIERVAKHDFEVVFTDEKGKEHNKEFKAPKMVKVSPYLLRGYSCLDYGCSKCCCFHGFVNIFSEEEYTEALQKYPEKKSEWDAYKPFTSIIKGETRTLYKYDHTDSICNHITVGEINGCSIHQLNPIHCAFPLMKFSRKGDVVNVIRQAFGRNHLSLKCPVVFVEPNESIYNYTIELLTRTERMAKSYNIETWVPEIIEKIKELWNKPDEYKSKMGQEVGQKVIYDGQSFEDFMKGDLEESK